MKNKKIEELTQEELKSFDAELEDSENDQQLQSEEIDDEFLDSIDDLDLDSDLDLEDGDELSEENLTDTEEGAAASIDEDEEVDL